MADTNNVLRTLEKHRANLAAATTWQEYRAAHVAYVDWCIERQKILLAGNKLARDFLAGDEAPVLQSQE